MREVREKEEERWESEDFWGIGGILWFWEIWLIFGIVKKTKGRNRPPARNDHGGVGGLQPLFVAISHFIYKAIILIYQNLVSVTLEHICVI